MAHKDGEACVYVKESVLRELEQERRRLKWQLSRALQTSDTRTAELEASKAKVKDLLTIVEVNKGVADQVMQRFHGRDTKRREELEVLHEQNKKQRQRYIDMVTRSMNRRVRDRQQREVFRSLHDVVLLRSRGREALMRLQARTRWRTLRRGLERWKCFCYSYGLNCCAGSAKVYPVPQEQLHASQAAFTTGQLIPQNGSTIIKSVDDDNSRQFVRWQLLRKMWRNWERVIRWKRRHNAFTKFTSQRCLRFNLVGWRSRARVLRQRRLLLRRILARTSRRIQQLGISSLRLRCAEVSAHEWAEVLKAAHIAMEEERKLRAEVQSSAASELHTAYSREQHRQKRFKELQTQRLQDFKRRECKHRTLLILRSEVIRTRQKAAIALRFQGLQQRQRELRKRFTTWKREATQSRRIKSVIAAWVFRRICSTKAKYFKLFAQTLQRRRQRRFRLRALMTKLRRAWLLRGWLCLRIRSAIEEHNAIAHVERWEFSQHAEAMRGVYQEDIRRSRKVALKYQITCALIMADKRQESLLRRVLCSWSKHTANSRRQRRTLRRLVACRHVKVLEAAVLKWNHINAQKTERCNQLHRYECTRRRRALETAFNNWKCKVHETLRMRLAGHQQRSCFRAWRQLHYLRQQRVLWFRHFLKRSIHQWQRQAFQYWKQKHEFYVKACIRRDHAEHELISRLWRRWIAFVAFRLHKQRRQQQKALTGVRCALQRTLLSTAFISWRTNSKLNKSREKLIVRAFRRSTSHSRMSKYLQAWCRHSVLMSRRRTALKRVCRLHNLSSLQTKWHHWIRASLCITITILESSSIQSQQQTERVFQSANRANTLRRTLRKWSLVSTESKRQQRRQALFAEKRRYITLQASLRQWQRKITCFSLSKQTRVLQHLLNRLRLSIERQAFRFWERGVHVKTLSERDRISAELFRRSEIRVLALAEEICAERERRAIFTSWRSITARKKKACERLQTILLKHWRWFLQNSWGAWVLCTQRQHCVARLHTVIVQRLKAHAWRKLMQMYQRHDLRSAGARRAGVLWYKILLRHAWNHWKREDSSVAKHAALTGVKLSSIESMLAFKETIARRHYRKRVLTLTVVAWIQRVACTKRLRRHLCDVLKRRAQATTAYHFQRWQKVVQRLNCLQQLLLRIVNREQARKVRSALDLWRRWTLEVAHRQQLEQTTRAVSRQRELSAQRIALVKFLSWQRPCLETHFVRWKVHVEQRRRYVVEQRIALSHRRTCYLLQSVWRSWYDLVCQSKRRTHLLAKTLTKTRLGLLALGFHRWDQWRSWIQDIDNITIRLIRIHELWQWRRGFTALRQHRHEVIRHQSIMAASAFSVHRARQRERQAKMMRAVALVLQKKTSTALCDRCLRHWILYVKAKSKMNSMIRQARVRSQKRAARRCFIEWQLYTRQNAILQLKIRRRQVTWEYRRQRRVWNAWVFFTQHSVDVKHSIYDRLFICALQHTLQGAWGRWKSYTRYANGLLDAQRVAQWENTAAERDKVLNTLEDKHECVLLRAAQLGQQNNVLRQRLVGFGTRKIHRVLELGHKSRVSAAFGVWKHKLQQIRALQSRMTALAIRYERLLFHRWYFTNLQLRAAERAKRAQLVATEWAARVVHTCATQWLKRRTLLSWKAFARTDRGIKRHITASKRRREHKLVECCWAGWKSTLAARDRQGDAIMALQARKTLKMLLQAYWQWRSVYERTEFTKHNAIRTLLLLRRAWKLRILLHGWNRWRTFVVEEDATILQTKLVLVELEQQRTTDRYICSQLLLSTFSGWRLYTCSQCKRREAYTQVLVAASRRRLLPLSFAWWKRRTARSQRQLLLLRRMERHLQRHCMILTNFALWTWFARVQAGSRVQLQVSLKQLAPTMNVPARITRAVLTDLMLAEHQLFRSQQRSAWRLVNATVRNARRRLLQTAFDCLASGAPVRGKRRFLTPTHVANARAFTDTLTTVLLRSGFQRWKRQYVALAIQEAEEAQQELLRALHHVTSYRQTLDPYARQI